MSGIPYKRGDTMNFDVHDEDERHDGRIGQSGRTLAAD